MGFLTIGRDILNHLLRPINARVESLTAERAETNRLRELERDGHFDKAIFPVLPQFRACDPSRVLQQIRRDQPRFAEIVNPATLDAFPLKNDYCTTPDAEVLYAVVQLYRPARIVEVGSGYSTQLFRRAIGDAGINTHLTSIDPDPRQEIVQHSDTVVPERVETAADITVFQQLQRSDILFIDSSHIVKIGNDVNWLVLSVVPQVASGVLIQFHDIFLPYEYPREWIVENRWNWTEQYLVHALLTGNNSFEVIWPGYYLQRTWPNFEAEFKHWRNSTARSLWLQKR
jgi:predicted O-methyltransferase YrrM